MSLDKDKDMVQNFIENYLIRNSDGTFDCNCSLNIPEYLVSDFYRKVLIKKN